MVVHHGRLPRLVGVIHRRARVKEEYRRRVSPMADAVVDSVVEVPAGFLEVLAARETHQRAVRDGEPAQQRAPGDVYCRPPADARDGGRPELGGKVRMERRSFRGPAPRSRQIPGEETKLQCYFTKDVKTWGPQSRFEPDSQSSDKRERTIDR